MVTVAALYVQKGGVYYGLPDVDPWDEERDARLYRGPHPVVAHPPCARWCRLAKFVESRGGKAVGDDDGCFAAALASVLEWGGVLEHPAWSMAWAAHGLFAPPANGWAKTIDGYWVCEVSQCAYGHRARKLTWLLYVGGAPPVLDWSRPEPTAVVSSCSVRVDGSFYRPSQKGVARVSGKESSATPHQFRDLLLALARDARRPEAIG